MGYHEPFNFPYLRYVNKGRRDAWKGCEEWTGADWSNEMMGEAGEAANIVKKLRRIETGAVRDGNSNRDALLRQSRDAG